MVVILTIIFIVRKLIIDLLIIMVLLARKLFVYGHLNFEGVLALMFCYSTKDKLDTTLLCFSLWLKQTYYLQCIITHCILCVLLFMCNIVTKFTLVQIIFIMPLLKYFDLSLQCFYISLIKIVCGCMSPQKLFCYHLPTRGRAGVKLGDADTLQTYL